jgi:tripeptidyl-peptidase I
MGDAQKESVVRPVNAARLNGNKIVRGFVNPALYANPWVLNDVVEGRNPGCGIEGFEASVGWGQ